MRASFPLAIFLGLAHLAGDVCAARAQDADTPNPAPLTAPDTQPDATPPDVTPNQAPDQTLQNAPDGTAAQAERNAQRRAQNEKRLRALMSDFGITEAPAQDALIAYLAEDEAGKSTVRAAARRLMLAVRADTATDRMHDLIAIYKAAIDADRERRRAAQSSLDAKIGFSLNPRLEATLWLLGVLGEGQTGLPFNVLFPRAPRDNHGDRDNQHDRNTDRDGRARDTNSRRGGTVRGFVTQKADGWIEVRADNGVTERYWSTAADATTDARVELGDDAPLQATAGAPLPPAPDRVPKDRDGGNRDGVARFNRATLQALLEVKIGARVRLDWMGSDRKRMVSLDVLQLQTAPPDAPKTADAVPTKPTPDLRYAGQ